MSKAQQQAAGAAFDQYTANILAFMIDTTARLNAMEQLCICSVAMLGAALPLEARQDWAGNLYSLRAVFNEASDNAAFADFDAEDLLRAAQVARHSSDHLARMVDQIVARLPPSGAD